MSYYTLSEIKHAGRFIDIRQKNVERFSKSNKTTVFLSHSHQDRDIIASVMAFLLDAGIYVYVDWLDPEMPKITSGVTASKLKDKIDECHRFIVLLTENSKDSRWVPWELGIADVKKTNENIGILPVKRYSYTRDSEFDGIEFMQLYRRIVFGNIIATGEPSPVILEPNADRGDILQTWLY